jgi:DNA polymerase-3 subunit alpha
MFSHLHVHTEYSLLDGLSRVPSLVGRAKDMGFTSLAITDHGALYGAVEFYSQCVSAGIKPIIGCEVYAAHGSRHDKSPAEKRPYHLTVLAKDNVGYRNLMQLVSKAHLEGFYYRPRIDKELLEQHHEGLFVFSGCPTAEVPRLIKDGRMEDARLAALWYRDLFADRYFLEVQQHSHVEQLDDINNALVDISRETSIPLVATNDCHYIHQKDAPLQDVLICIHTNTTMQNEKRMRMLDDSYYLKSPLEMEALFVDFPMAVANTQKIADMCDVELEFGQLHLPHYPVPDGADSDEYLSRLCWEGFRRLYPDPPEGARERLLNELDVIRRTRFADYFLVVWDIISFVHRSQILYGVRGSAAASLALYCLGVTQIDPLEYSLVFERFLNVERREMPDIDMDFQDDRRDEVLRYVVEKYGRDKVAQIITFGTLGTKASIRDVGRALGMAYTDVDRIARMVPPKARTIDDAVATSVELRDVYERDGAIKNLIETAKALEGTAHHVSTHAAGVVISAEPLADRVPLQWPSRGNGGGEVQMTQYAMKPVAMLGLLKMDFLGLTSLAILDRAVKMVKQTRGVDVELYKLSLGDEKTFQLLSSGKTSEVFQLESAGMQRYIGKLKPSVLGDISAMIALYRPGPMEHIDRFIDSKHGRTKTEYPHPSLQAILEETYGVIVYQEQVLKILQIFAGYSAGEADVVRKAMGKKIAELMGKERARFVKGAGDNGFEKAIAEDVFNLIEPFAGYAFNKAHSVSYALVSYWTAYFKANYPMEYMASVLNSRVGQTERSVGAINECFRMDIQVLPPDINRSKVHFAIDHSGDGAQGLRIGLAAVKNVGEGGVELIIEEREKNGLFKSIDDMCGRFEPKWLNRRALESLIKAGAFDCFGERGHLVGSVGQILAQVQREGKVRDSGQTSMFDQLLEPNLGETVGGLNRTSFTVGNESSTAQKVSWEKELLGVALSTSSLKSVAIANRNGLVTSRDQIKGEVENEKVSLIGLVSTVSRRYTQQQKPYLIASVELVGGALEVIAWSDVLEATGTVWQEGNLVMISGRMKNRGDRISLHCNDARIFSEEEIVDGSALPTEPLYGRANEMASSERLESTLLIKFMESEDSVEDRQKFNEVKKALLECPGTDRVNLEIHTNGRRVRLDWPPMSTGYDPQLQFRLDEILGPGAVHLIDGNGITNGK